MGRVSGYVARTVANVPNDSKSRRANGCHVSFEMYGARNTHLVVYERNLEVAVLFGVTRDASVIPLHKLNLLDVPGASRFGEITAGEDAVAKYAEIRALNGAAKSSCGRREADRHRRHRLVCRGTWWPCHRVEV